MARLLLGSIVVTYFLAATRLTLEQWDVSTYSTPRDGEIAGYVNGVAYTYMKPYIGLPERRLNRLYNDMVADLGYNNSENMSKLRKEITEEAPLDAHSCYLQIYGTFMSHCYPKYIYGGLRRFKQMFAQACRMEWLNTSTINDHVMRLCKDF